MTQEHKGVLHEAIEALEISYNKPVYRCDLSSGDMECVSSHGGELNSVEVASIKATIAKLRALVDAEQEIKDDYKDVIWFKHGDDIAKFYESEATLHEMNERYAALLQTAIERKERNDQR